MEIFGATLMGQRGFTDYMHISFACSVTKAIVGARADPRTCTASPGISARAENGCGKWEFD